MSGGVSMLGLKVLQVTLKDVVLPLEARASSCSPDSPTYFSITLTVCDSLLSAGAAFQAADA